jgi:hypothetical protein
MSLIDLYPGDFKPAHTEAGEFVLTRKSDGVVAVRFTLASAERFLLEAIDAYCAAREVTLANSAEYAKRRAEEAAASKPGPPTRKKPKT